MKKMILFMLLAWLCSIGVLSAQDQSDVTNDNLINYYVKLRALKWNVNNDGDAEESAWRWKWRTTSSYPVDCNESQWGSGNYEFCYTETKEYNTWLYPEEEMFEGANKPVTDKFYFHVKGHENDGANDCFYDQDVFNEDNNAHCYAGERTIGSIGNRNDWGYSTRDNDNRYAYQFAAVYRYSNGDAFNRPLTFGTIANGQNKYHYNSNKSAPSGSNSNCGYARNLYDNAAADVVYSFTINSPMNVTISTDHSATDFDTKVYLFSNADRIIASDNNSGSGTKSTLTRFLCAGTYKVLVGGNSNKTGNFRLRIYGVNATAITSEGSIRGPGAVCRGTNIPKITSTAAGTVSCGAVSYQWRKWNGSTYAVISGAIGAEYDPPENMGSDRLYYYRETKDQYGYTRGTDVITIRPASASANVGSISFSGSTTIPGGTDPGSFSSRTNASASPAIKAVYWEKQESTDGGISWTNWSAVTNTSSISQSYNVPTLSKSTRYRRTVLSTCDNSNNPVRRSTAYTQINVVPADGVITGRVTSSLGTGVSGVRVNVNRTTNVSGGTNANGSGTAITDGNGEYTISGLYYGGSSANFRVTPSRANHEFDPANRNITVNSSSPKSANFTDITVFTLTGNVSQDFGSTSCNIADIKVDLLFNGVVINPNDGYTDENGDYTLTIENQGTYTIRPQLTGHIFAPANATFFIDDNRSNVNFKDITQFSLQGKILAGAGTAEGCQQFMGTATVTLTDVDNCFTITGTTDGAGFFQITGIPSKVYNVKVTDLNPISAYASKELEIESFYDTNGRAVDLSSASQNEDFYYQAEPVIVVEGLPEPPCTYEYPVLAQSEVTPLLIQVFEEGTTCPVDTGTISINDQIGDMGDEPITFEFKGGSFEYNLKAGNPNIVSPHLKNLTISAIDTFERPSETYNPSVLVTGGRPRAQNFSTQSPQLPLFILRDPPGDASYSYLEENTTTETATRFYVSDSESSNTWGNVRIGLKFGVSILGLETETAFWGDVGGSYEVNSTNANSTETILSVSNTTRFETTDSDVIQGSEGDVFVGAALAFAYAISDEVIFDENTCQVLMDKNLVIANEGLESEFIFTENHIKASVIPELQDLRDHPNTTAAEQADYDNQILVWEQMLQRNDELKAAAEFVEVVQFGGNSPKEKTTTSTTTDISTIEFGMEINEEIASEMGFEIGGSGINGGLITNFKMESGNSTTETEINSLT
ncbi:MAG: carboxypeptidase-like regulatory domain-containing protein, partial [Bacteroidota bacterium]